jgi:hypothetical protein
VARRAGDRLSEHAALAVEDPGREIAGLAHAGAERGAHQRLGLLLHHRDQAVPHDLLADLGDPLGLAHAGSSERWRVMTM